MVRKAGLHDKARASLCGGRNGKTRDFAVCAASIFGGCAVLRRAGLYGKARQAVVEDATIKTRDFAVCEGKHLERVCSGVESRIVRQGEASFLGWCAVVRRAGLHDKARQAVVEDATIKTRDFTICAGRPLEKA